MDMKIEEHAVALQKIADIREQMHPGPWEQLRQIARLIEANDRAAQISATNRHEY